MNSLPKTVTRQRRGCDLNPGPSAPASSMLTTRLPSHSFNSCSIKRVLSRGPSAIVVLRGAAVPTHCSMQGLYVCKGGCAAIMWPVPKLLWVFVPRGIPLDFLLDGPHSMQ